MTVMPADHIVALRRDSNRIALGVAGRLNHFVPSCPGWQVADLVWHLGIVHMFWRMVARGVLAGPEAWSEPDRPDTDDLLAWFVGGVDLTADILDSLDPDMPAWTWGRRQDVGFIRRSGPGNRCALLGCRQRYWMQRAHRTDTRSRRRRRIPRRGTTWSLA